MSVLSTTSLGVVVPMSRPGHHCNLLCYYNDVLHLLLQTIILALLRIAIFEAIGKNNLNLFRTCSKLVQHMQIIYLLKPKKATTTKNTKQNKIRAKQKTKTHTHTQI